MILVDIQVPVLDRIYDFELDETLTAEKVMQKIVKIIKEKEQLDKDLTEKLYLYSWKQEKVLNGEYSLKEQDVKSGERLILI